MKIAIAEQDELLADLISFRLELIGHEVAKWPSATKMLAELVDSRVDLLIVDMHQSDLSGCDTIQNVRRKLSPEELPILAISVDTDLSLVEQAYKAGADDYLITPFDPAVLQHKTDSLLLRRRDCATAK